MRFCIIWLSLLTAGVLPVNASQPAEDPPPVVNEYPKAQFTVAAASLNQYVWRGLRITHDPVFQPTVTLGWGNFSLNTWASMDLGQANNREYDFSELDFTLDYSFKLSSCSVGLGDIQYTFPNTDYNSTRELYLGLGVDAVMHPALRIYKDIDECNGTYVSMGFGHSLPLDFMRTSLDFSTSLGWGSSKHNRFYYNVEKNSGADINFGVGVPFSFQDRLTITPTLGYSGLLGGSVRRALESKDHFLAGITVTGAF